MRRITPLVRSTIVFIASSRIWFMSSRSVPLRHAISDFGPLSMLRWRFSNSALRLFCICCEVRESRITRPVSTKPIL